MQQTFHTVDQLLHFIQTHKFIYPVRVIIAGAEVYGSKIKFRSQNGNVAEAPKRRLKAEAADMLLKLLIFAIIIHRVIAAHAVKLHDIIDLRDNS